MPHNAIWKFSLANLRDDGVDMPAGSKIISAGIAQGVLCVWAKVATDLPMQKRLVRVVGTGFDLPEFPGKFIGTVIDDPFVWHVFDDGPRL